MVLLSFYFLSMDVNDIASESDIRQSVAK